MAKSVVARFDEVILVTLDPKEDLIGGIKQICRDRKIKTGVILSIVGGVSEALVSSWGKIPDGAGQATAVSQEQHRHTVQKTGIYTDVMSGPLAVTGTGMIGVEEDGEPYVHVHLTLTNAAGTVCAQIWEGGTPVQSLAPQSHFTIAIARAVGAELRDLSVAHGEFKGIPYHEIVEVPIA